MKHVVWLKVVALKLYTLNFT